MPGNLGEGGRRRRKCFARKRKKDSEFGKAGEARSQKPEKAPLAWPGSKVQPAALVSVRSKKQGCRAQVLTDACSCMELMLCSA